MQGVVQANHMINVLVSMNEISSFEKAKNLMMRLTMKSMKCSAIEFVDHSTGNDLRLMHV